MIELQDQDLFFHLLPLSLIQIGHDCRISSNEKNVRADFKTQLYINYFDHRINICNMNRFIKAVCY